MTRPIAVGNVYRDRKVVKTAEFGAFVELRKGTDGLLHASRISPGVRVDSVDQVLTRGDIVTVEVTEVDTERGRVGLKLVSKQENGAEITAEAIGVRYKEQFPNAGQGGGARRATAIARRRPRARRGSRPRRSGGGGGRRSEELGETCGGAGLSPSRGTSRLRRSCCCMACGAAPAGIREWLAAARSAPADRDRPAGLRRLAALPGGGFDLAAVCARVEASIGELGVGARSVLGHSLGGGVAGATRPSGPVRCSAVALVAPAGLIARVRAPVVAPAAPAHRAGDLIRAVIPLRPGGRSAATRLRARRRRPVGGRRGGCPGAPLGRATGARSRPPASRSSTRACATGWTR